MHIYIRFATVNITDAFSLFFRRGGDGVPWGVRGVCTQSIAAHTSRTLPVDSHMESVHMFKLKVKESNISLKVRIVKW